MADVELENTLGFVDKRKTQGSINFPIGVEANYMDVANLRTRLNAANPSYYTTVRCNEMTKNDMIFALRTIDDAAGI